MWNRDNIIVIVGGAAFAIFLTVAFAHSQANAPTAIQEVPWKPLTARERAAVRAEIAKLDVGEVTIACAWPGCRRLAADLGEAFSSQKWIVKRINRGGIGIDGISGIRMDTCGLAKQEVLEVLRVLDTRDVSVVIDDACAKPDDTEINIVIGRPSP